MQFSVIIPAKNEEANIGRCLDSIAGCRWDADLYEVIVVDNGSSDRTVQIAREKGATVLVRPDLTISGVRNLGAAEARGEILAFLDADCAVAPGWFAAASRYLCAGDVAAFGSPVVVPEEGTWVQKAWFNVRGKPGRVVDVEWLESANLLVQRSAFLAVHGFDERLVTCEDYDLTQRLKGVGRLVSDHRVEATHYREPATVKAFVKKEMWRGKSNYTGLLSRRVPAHELPSLVLPLVHLVFCAGCLLLIAAALARQDERLLRYALALFCLWQAPIVAMSFRKNRSGGLLTVLQLLILFNSYFFARGAVALQRD